MKSRTSFFNQTVFKKDLTRFAPIWGIYTILLLLVLISTANVDEAYYRLQNVRDFILSMSWPNLIYAALVAQLLFGDLFNSRLCNALHALPIRRECWFGSHIASGILFSLLPNLVLALIALPALRLGNGRAAIFWWLLASELQYIFFYGVAVLCIMLTGNRFGHLAMCTIIQFGGLLTYWIADAIYEPFLHGVLISETPFMLLCPLGQILQAGNVLRIDYEKTFDALGLFDGYLIYGVTPGDGWGYMAICAGIGLLMMAAALVLYRKRKLECTGDFVAFSAMEPVVTVIVTVFVGAIFHLFADAFGMNLRSVMLGSGMIIGYFVCQMLLERTTRVFCKKTFLRCAVIVAVFGLTVLLTYLDPLGITRYVPAPEDVESITVSNGYSLYNHGNFPYEATEADEIAQLMEVHRDGINKETGTVPANDDEYYNVFDIRLEYKLKNGKTVNRFYDVHPHSHAGVILEDYFNTTQMVLGHTPEKLRKMVPFIQSIYVEGREGRETDLAGLDLDGLMEAIIADCEAGNMSQISTYHFPSNYDYLSNTDYDHIVAYLEIGWDRDLAEIKFQTVQEGYGTISYASYNNLRVYRSCENTLKWMEDNGLLTEEMQKEMIEKIYGPLMAFSTS